MTMNVTRLTTYWSIHHAATASEFLDSLRAAAEIEARAITAEIERVRRMLSDAR